MSGISAERRAEAGSASIIACKGARGHARSDLRERCAPGKVGALDVMRRAPPLALATMIEC